MNRGAFEDGESCRLVIFAMAVVMLAQLVNLRHRRHPPTCSQDRIDGKPEHHADSDLRANNSEHRANRHPFGDEDRQHLVGSGQENSKERAQCDNAAGIECCRSSRETALRHRSEQCADQRPAFARTLDGALGPFTCSMLDPFHHEICDEQERNQIQRVEEGIQEHVRYRVEQARTRLYAMLMHGLPFLQRSYEHTFTSPLNAETGAHEGQPVSKDGTGSALFRQPPSSRSRPAGQMPQGH